MDFTEKQVRNGAVGSTETANTAVPGPDATAEIKGLIRQAESMAAGRHSASVFARPAGDSTIVDWETNVASHEPAGEA